MLTIHLKRLLLVHAKWLGYAALHNDDYNRDAVRPYKSYTTIPFDTDSFQHRATYSFFHFPFLVQISKAINDCRSICEYPHLFICFAESKQLNIGQSYRLCLQIEWQPSRQQMFVGGLGCPDSCRAVQQARWINFANGR